MSGISGYGKRKLSLFYFCGADAGKRKIYGRGDGRVYEKNAQVIEEVVCPAYERLMAAVRELKGTGKNEEGLCGLPQGQEYYQVLVDQSVGTKESIVQLEELTRRQMEDDITAMEGVLGQRWKKRKNLRQI